MRFNRERISIPDLHQSTAVEAFRNGLLAENELYKNLTKFKCYTMDQVMARAQTEIRWEEDKRNKRKDSSSSRHEERFPNPPKRAKDSEIIARRPLDRNGRRIMENRPRNREYDSRPSAYTIRGQAASSRPRLPDYNFTVSPGDMVSILKRMGDTVRWPQRPRDGPSKKDTTKWCEFLSTLLRAIIKKNIKTWEDCLPHVEFAYNRLCIILPNFLLSRLSMVLTH